MSADQSARQITAGKTGEKPAEDQAGTGDTHLRRRIRELAADLVRDVLGTMAMASAAEIGELIKVGEHNRERDGAPSAGGSGQHSGAEAHKPPLKRRVRARTSEESTGSPVAGRQGSENERDTKSSPAPNDPFDITSPGELLASTDEPHPQPQVEEPRPPGEPFVRQPSATSAFLEPHPADSATTLVEGDKEASSERRPRVALRAGESLLSSTGSGVVIRRERRILSPAR